MGSEMRRDEFSTCHPVVNFGWFALVLAFTMVFDHPVMQGISLGCAVGYSALLKGKKALRFQLVCLLPLALFAMVLNPVFNHEGATILRWLPSGNPLTLESILSGVSAAVMLVTAVIWFSCVNEVLTSDKFVWLFGRVIPALALVLSMTLRFIPRFTRRMREVSAARQGAGYGGGKGLSGKIKHGLTVLSVVVTWALERAIDTADSMKSRGYGLPGRSAFSIYRWERRDTMVLLFMLYAAGYVIAGSAAGGIHWRYFPRVGGEVATPYAISIFLTYLALCLMPLYLYGREELKWKSMLSEL